MHASRFILSLSAAISLAAICGAVQSPPGPSAPYDDDVTRAIDAAALAERSRLNKVAAEVFARRHGLPIRYEIDGVTRELIALDEQGRPLYYSTGNDNAAISTGANVLRDNVSYALQGHSVTVGVWDAGSVLSTHQEFGTRVSLEDAAASHYHSTHVAGTIGAAGVVARAEGMAPDCRIVSYDWNSDSAEMAAAGASAPGQGNSRIYLSNHSYGLDGGWFWDTSGGSGWHWRYGGSVMQDPLFGQYSAEAVSVDTVAHGAPYYLIMFCGMNSRNDGPSSGDTAYIWNGSGYSAVTYDPATHPLGDGVYKGGYDTLAWHAVAKNCLTVGAVDDAVASLFGRKFRWPAFGTMSDFSNWGPTDDGRIKPDVVGNGVNLYSTDNGNNSDYRELSGTSMATPNVCGTAAQLLELFRHMGDEPRSSTMKALLIHTADDLGTLGPDYVFGWGLVDGVYAADVIAADTSRASVTHIHEGLLDGAHPTVDYGYASPGFTPLRATLCWTDPPGSATSGDDDRTARLVNDLDLRVLGPGATYAPFRLDVNNPAAAATRGNNSRDNVEQVLINSPPAGGYTVRVSHNGPLSSGAQYFSLVVTTEPYPLPAPQNLSATDGTLAFNIALYWDSVHGAASYKIFRSLSSSPNTAVQIGTSSDTYYSDIAVLTGAVYHYWVKAVSTLSDSAFSAADTGFLEPRAPLGVTASDGAHIDRVAVAWNAAPGATGYQVYRGTSAMPGSSVPIGTSAGPQYLDTSVTPGTSYYYWVKTLMHSATSYFSNGEAGYALLTLDCPDWKVRAKKKLTKLKGKNVTPAVVSLLEAGWNAGVARIEGTEAHLDVGPYSLTPNKKHTAWKFKAKKEAKIKYKTRKQKIKIVVWTNLPPAWAVYVRP